jgi:hypothetical protein
MFIPNPNFSIRLQGQTILDPHQVFLTQNIVSKLSKIWSGMFFPDPDLDFLPIPDPGVKKARDPQHWLNIYIFLQQ